MGSESKFEQWAVVELMGHARLAGRITEDQIGGCSFIRVDVPALNGLPAFTRWLGAGAIYSITAVSEEMARLVVEQQRARPVTVYAPQIQRALPFAEDADDATPDEDVDPPPYEDFVTGQTI